MLAFIVYELYLNTFFKGKGNFKYLSIGYCIDLDHELKTIKKRILEFFPDLANFQDSQSHLCTLMTGHRNLV